MSASTSDYTTVLRLMMLPKDTNQYGTVFGGVILSAIDQAGFIEARRHGLHRWVTAAMDQVEFLAPVQVGDVVSFHTRTASRGRTSVKVHVRVEAERFTTGDMVQVTEASITMVSVNAAGRPIPFESPPSVAVPTFEARADDERAASGEGDGRRHGHAASEGPHRRHGDAS